MRNIVNLSLTALLIMLSSMATALDHKKLDTQFSINEVINNIYSFDICIPKKEGMASSITLVYWDGTNNILTVHPESLEFNQAWLHSNVLYQAYDETKRVSISVDFNLESGERIKTEVFSLSTVIKDFKNRDLIVPTGQKYVGCSKPNNSGFGEVHFFTTE